MRQAVMLALPKDKAAEWPVASDSVQAISCLIEALYHFTLQGRHFLYESSVEGVLHILMHLAHSPTYLAIITGKDTTLPSCICKSNPSGVCKEDYKVTAPTDDSYCHFHCPHRFWAPAGGGGMNTEHRAHA
jgi:hypothetical protein